MTNSSKEHPKIIDDHTKVGIDLARSNLTLQDIHGRIADHTELSVCKVILPPVPVDAHPEPSAYVIPYQNFQGKAITFYRLRILTNLPGQSKYRQPAGSSNHIYFPPQLQACLSKPSYPNIFILTEGEKKAAALVKIGIPAAAFGGVDNWVNHTLVLPKSITFTQAAKGKMKAKLTAEQQISVSDMLQTSGYALGFVDLISYFKANPKLYVIIIYDSDVTTGCKYAVQVAAARLGHELRRNGIATHHIRQLILPIDSQFAKVGVDDYLVNNGTKSFTDLITYNLTLRTAFPRHPDPKSYVQQQLVRGRSLTRDDINKLALTITTELDIKGRRLRQNETSGLFYFNEHDCTLIPVVFPSTTKMMNYPESFFGRFLYKKYGVT